MNPKRYMFILPSLLGVLVFSVFPFIMTLINSFTDNKGWLNNYKQVFNNSAFKLASYNTIKFIIICVPILLFISLLLSIFILNNENKLSVLLKSICLLPFAIPVSAVVIVWQSIFHNNGMLNMLLHIVNIPPIDWLNSKYSFVILVITYIWKNLGYTTIIWLASLMSISIDQYEAASIDGATQITQFIFITLPNLKRTVLLLLVLSTMNAFKVFREIYLIGGDYPNKNIYMLQHLLNNWFRDLNMTSISVVGSLIGFFFCLIIIVFFKFLESEGE